MEYTVLGDCVNLSARLMFKAPQLGIYCDEETKNRSTQEIVFNALTPIRVKGKTSTINIYQPVLKEPATQIGLTRDKKIRFPWYDNSFAGGSSGNDGGSNVTKLCSVKGWDAMAKASALLGSGFNKSIHSKDVVIEPGKANFKPTQGTPFDQGGAIVIEGKTGMGQQEVAEHIIMHAAVNFKMMPVFGTMGPRPGDSSRLAVELLRSCLGIFRHNDPALGEDEGHMLHQCVPQDLQRHVPVLSNALKDQASKERSGDILFIALDVVIALVQKLLQQTPVLMCLQFEYGTSLFPKTLQDQVTFWKAIDKLTELVNSNDSSNAFVMIVISQTAERSCRVVQDAMQANTLLHLEGLSDSSILEYVSNILGIQEAFVPHPLRAFVAKVTLGNPHFIQETLQQLIEDQFISVILGTNGQAKNIEHKDLWTVNLSAWGHTRMVGGTKNLLESLDPLEAAVLKMSTCFLGSFTLPDLAASTCSRWAGATHFDLLRLFKALRKLVAQNIVEVVEAPEDELGAKDNNCQRFQCNNILIRDVGGSMVLEQQKKSVKRQALIDRTLNRELPSRMEVVQQKKSVHHIPWYYEQAFKRMM